LRDRHFVFVRTIDALRLKPLPFWKAGMGLYAFISTSTPLGKSSLLNASTVLEEEV
jgi:hypothetical protein